MNGPPTFAFEPGLQDLLQPDALARWSLDDLHMAIIALKDACNALPAQASDTPLMFLSGVMAALEASAFARTPADMTEFAILIDLVIDREDAACDQLQGIVKTRAAAFLPQQFMEKTHAA